MGVYSLNDKDFGEMILHTRRGMRSMSVRWENGKLRINIPEGVTTKWIFDTLEPMREKIAQLDRRTITYQIGQVIRCYRHTIKIGVHNGKVSNVGYGGKDSELYVNVSSKANLSSAKLSELISKCMRDLMACRAEHYLKIRALEIAHLLNLQPSSIVIGRGFRKLGHCTAKREIQLSYNLMFLPSELVDYVIYHEFAHLTHMNHSAAFHSLCNSYCNGREAHLELALKNFKWEILR